MVQLIPKSIAPNTNYGEKVIFESLNDVRGHDDWIVLHGLHQYKVVQGVETEGDFIVLAPGLGIAVIESKGATSAILEGDKWTLEGVPEKAKNKSPLEQAEHVRNNVRALIATNEIDATSLPIARIVWFPKMDPLEFAEVGNKGMEFYPWEICFKRDLNDIALTIEDAIKGETRSGAEKGRSYKPEAFDEDEMLRIRDALHVRASAAIGKDGLEDIRRVQLKGAADYLTTLWDALSSNDNFFVEGPAGTGKTMLLKIAVNFYAGEGRKVLVTCNSLMMADELTLLFEHQPNVDVIDIATYFRDLARIKEDKKTNHWFEVELPTKALNALKVNEHLGRYDVVCVDEFQDIAGRPEAIEALQRSYRSTEDGAPPVFFAAGDDYQQILNSQGPVVGRAVAGEVTSHQLVNIFLSRNCRQAPGLSRAIYKLLDWENRGLNHDLTDEMDWSLEVVATSEEQETTALANALKKLLEKNGNHPERIRVLSPFGEKQSLLAKLFQRDPINEAEEWLKANLRHKSSEGQIRWRSIPKFKGLEEDAVVLTDINKKAIDFAASINHTLDELVYVGLTRARFDAVLLVQDQVY